MSVFVTGAGDTSARIRYVEYLQSTGMQYIDTGVLLTPDLSVSVDYQVLTATNDTWFFSALNVSSMIGMRAGVFNSAFYLTNMKASQPDLTKRTVFTGQATQECALSPYLFAENRDGAAYGRNAGRLYSCQIYVSGALVRDFRPCYDPEGVACLYDKVEEKYYYNAGTGDFIAG